MPKTMKVILRIPKAKQLASISGFVAIAVLFLATSTSMAGNPGFEQLKGRWVRPDGGYIIEITSVGEDGQLDAKYYNPRSIHVEKAEAVQKDGKTEVFIELQDINYPGSTYRLRYNAEKEVLEGIYFQALERQQFQIYFKRMK